MDGKQVSGEPAPEDAHDWLILFKERLMELVKSLSESQIERIRAASLDILENVGVRVEHAELLRRLKAAGARVRESDGLVRLPASLVRELLAMVPPRYTICQLDGAEDVVENGRALWLGNLLLPNIIDYRTQQPRRPSLADQRLSNAVFQNMAPIRAIYRMEVPLVEEEDRAQRLLSLEEYVVNNGKHMFMFGTSSELLEHYLTVGRIISDARGVPLHKILSASCTIGTPLKVPQFYGEYLLRCCEAGFAVSGTIAPNAGATAPYSMAGCLLMGNAENLFVAAVSQIIRPGNPFFYMHCASVTDMRTGLSRFYSIDRVLWRVGLGQLARSYNIPFIIDAGGSMTHRYDPQTGVEGALAMMAAHGAGPAWIGGLGCMQNGLSWSVEMMLIHAHAWLETAQFLERGIEMDEERLGLESIRRIGPGGNFLTDELTLKMLREPEFFSNNLFDMTAKGASEGMLERAHNEAEALAENFKSPVPGDLQERLRRYFQDQRRRG